MSKCQLTPQEEHLQDSQEPAQLQEAQELEVGNLSVLMRLFVAKTKGQGLPGRHVDWL